MQTSTKKVLQVINILAWITFVGQCFKTGTIIFSFFAGLFIDAETTKKLYILFSLPELYHFDIRHYILLVTTIILIAAAKAYVLYLTISIFHKINFVHPFSEDVSFLISRIAQVSLGIGIVSLLAEKYCEWLVQQGVTFPDMQPFLGGATEFLLLGGIIFMIAQVFKRGIEIQSENELTV